MIFWYHVKFRLQRALFYTIVFSPKKGREGVKNIRRYIKETYSGCDIKSIRLRVNKNAKQVQQRKANKNSRKIR